MIILPKIRVTFNLYSHKLIFYDFRLCSLLGTIFGFVGSEIMSKMNTLRTLTNKDTHGHFRTMKSMVAFEREQNLLHKTGYTSGSRTLLRLHRGLGKNNFLKF